MKAFIGEKNQAYYLSRFSSFKLRPLATANWNWAAAFLPALWALFRKMYWWLLLALVLGFVDVIVGSSFRTGNELRLDHTIGAALLLAAHVWFAVYANALYYKKFCSVYEQSAAPTQPMSIVCTAFAMRAE